MVTVVRKSSGSGSGTRITREYASPAFDYTPNPAAKFLGEYINYASQSGRKALMDSLPVGSPIFQAAIHSSIDSAFADTPVAKVFTSRPDLTRMGNLVEQYSHIGWQRIQSELIPKALCDFEEAKTILGELFDHVDTPKRLVELLTSDQSLTLAAAARICVLSSDKTPRSEDILPAEALEDLATVLERSDHYYEKNLILAVIGKSEKIEEKLCEADLSEFLHMERAIRDLKMQRFIGSLWNSEECVFGTLSDIKLLIPKYRRARMRIYSLPGVMPPSYKEKTIAIASNLSEFQERLISDTVGKIDLTAFAAVLSKGEFVLDDYLPADNFRGAARLIHKLYTSGKIRKNECNLLAATFSKRVASLSKDDLRKLKRAITLKTERGSYLQELYMLSLASSMTSLKSVAALQAEFHILADFLGYPIHAPSVLFDDSETIYRDSISNAIMGSCMKIKIGERSFKSELLCEGEPNATKLAIEVFELFALAGWLKTPDELRVALFTADLAIIGYQLKQKTTDTLLVENKANTKAVALFEEGKLFYGIHAGLNYKLFRKNRMFLSSPFPVLSTSQTSLGGFLPALPINNDDRGTPSSILEDGDFIMLHTHDLVSQLCEHEMGLIIESYRDPRSIRQGIDEMVLLRTDSDSKYKAMGNCSCPDRCSGSGDLGLHLRIVGKVL